MFLDENTFNEGIVFFWSIKTHVYFFFGGAFCFRITFPFSQGFFLLSPSSSSITVTTQRQRKVPDTPSSSSIALLRPLIRRRSLRRTAVVFIAPPSSSAHHRRLVVQGRDREVSNWHNLNLSQQVSFLTNVVVFFFLLEKNLGIYFQILFSFPKLISQVLAR